MATSKHTTISRRAALMGGASVIALAGAAAVAAAAIPAAGDPLVPLGAAYDKAKKASYDLDVEILSWPLDAPRMNDKELDDLVTELVDRKWDVIDQIAVLVPSSVAGAAVVFRVLADLREIGDSATDGELTRNLHAGFERLTGAL